MQAKILLHNFLTNGTVISANLREVRGILVSYGEWRLYLFVQTI